MNIFFTMDIDWAPDYMIEHSLNFFRDNNIKCTVFATHKTKTLNDLDENLFEIGIHPNFNFILNGKKRDCSKKIISELLELFPGALGVRSHSMTTSSVLLNEFHNLGLKYESNIFLPYNWQIKPHLSWNKLLRIPYNWEDDIHFMYNNSFESGLNLNNKNFYVLNFHPIHIFLNTKSQEHYINAKAKIEMERVPKMDKKIIKNLVNKEAGVKSFLIKTINKIKTQNLNTGLLKDLL